MLWNGAFRLGRILYVYLYIYYIQLSFVLELQWKWTKTFFFRFFDIFCCLWTFDSFALLNVCICNAKRCSTLYIVWYRQNKCSCITPANSNQPSTYAMHIFHCYNTHNIYYISFNFGRNNETNICFFPSKFAIIEDSLFFSFSIFIHCLFCYFNYNWLFLAKRHAIYIRPTY